MTTRRAAVTDKLRPAFPCSLVPRTNFPADFAALSLCDCVVCTDAGQLHLAAALGKPIRVVFGRFATRAVGGPGKTPHELLQLRAAIFFFADLEGRGKRLAGCEPCGALGSLTPF